MLFIVIAVPSRFADRCEALLEALTRHAFGAAELTSCSTLEEIARYALYRGASYSVVTARYPGGRLMRALTEAGRPFIVVLDDLRSALAHLVCRQGLDIAAATRAVANSCAAALCFSTLPGALILRAERYKEGPLAAAGAIVHHLQLDIRDGGISDVLHSVGEPNASENVDVDGWWDGLDRGERAVAIGALGAYREPDAIDRLGTITWGRELFFVEDQPNKTAALEIDITGRARCLLRGPQILLPPATWLLTASLVVSSDAAEHGLVLEAAAGTVLSRTRIQPRTSSGVVEANLSLALPELPDEPIELRLYNERPAFGGHVSLLHVTAVPQPAAEVASVSADLPPTGRGGA